MNNLFPSGFNIIEPSLNLETMPIYAQQWNLVFTQMQKGSENIILDATHTPNMQLGYTYYPYAIEAKGSFPANAILLFYTKTASDFTFHHKPIQKYELNLVDKDIPIDFLSTQQSEIYTITIEESLFYEAFYNYFGQGLKSFLQTQIFQIKHSALDDFLQGLTQFIDFIQNRDETQLKQEYQTIENKIFEHIFSSLSIAKTPKTIDKFDISKVRDLLQTSLKEDIDIKTISHKLAISERQLHHAFKLAYGFTPKQYLQNLRLNAIKNEFLYYPESKVSDVAMKYHFLHMGHFSSEFKKMFGETPSAVLKSSKS